jgi:hypothetical protein
MDGVLLFSFATVFGASRLEFLFNHVCCQLQQQVPCSILSKRITVLLFRLELPENWVYLLNGKYAPASVGFIFDI